MLEKINNKIMAVLGITESPVEAKREMMEKYGSIILEGIMINALNVLPKEDQEEFEKMVLENPSPEAILNFLSTKVPTFEKIIDEEIEKIKEVLKLNTAK